ncbi:MAG TPA: UDP-glucose 4-epimerase GalE [Acidobacteriota bacterium]|nr:UDP-glucose 4-epimerase GalE [Acidobacteriota bacterium]
MNTCLVTGGAGYIGSHAVAELNRRGFRTIVIDNLSEGHREAVFDSPLEVVDLSDERELERVFDSYQIDGVMHFASLCYVGESMTDPRKYFEQNLGNALTLLRVMLRHGVVNFILSSTCATYGNPLRVPIDESHPQDPVSPYGETKYFIERILKHYSRAYGLRFVALRYFNAAGASRDSRLGESHDPETHLIPRVLQAAKGGGAVDVYGDDYPTPDGSCIRDYIHVEDLASAHVAALEWLERTGRSDFFNLGTGHGYSVKEVIETAKRITGCPIQVRLADRRAGDPPELVADARKAQDTLGWKAQYSDLDTIIQTAWQWELQRRY